MKFSDPDFEQRAAATDLAVAWQNLAAEKEAELGTMVLAVAWLLADVIYILQNANPDQPVRQQAQLLVVDESNFALGLINQARTDANPDEPGSLPPGTRTH